MVEIDSKALHYAMQQKVSRCFSDYVVENTLTDRLLDRCDLFLHQPSSILNIGCRHGYSTKQLANKYAKATIRSVDVFRGWAELFDKRDLSDPMTAIPCYSELPDKTHSYDFIFSSLGLSLTSHWQACFQAWQRVLKPGGVLLFSCLGVDTLSELKHVFEGIDSFSHIYTQPDMHDVGDALLSSHYDDPVMHRDVVTLYYHSLDQLFDDLRNMGCGYYGVDRSKTSMGGGKWKKVLSRYHDLRDEQGRYPVTIEIIYGQAVAPSLDACNQYQQKEICIPVENITRPIKK